MKKIHLNFIAFISMQMIAGEGVSPHQRSAIAPSPLDLSGLNASFAELSAFKGASPDNVTTPKNARPLSRSGRRSSLGFTPEELQRHKEQEAELAGIRQRLFHQR